MHQNSGTLTRILQRAAPAPSMKAGREVSSRDQRPTWARTVTAVVLPSHKHYTTVPPTQLSFPPIPSFVWFELRWRTHAVVDVFLRNGATWQRASHVEFQSQSDFTCHSMGMELGVINAHAQCSKLLLFIGRAARFESSRVDSPLRDLHKSESTSVGGKPSPINFCSGPNFQLSKNGVQWSVEELIMQSVTERCVGNRPHPFVVNKRTGIVCPVSHRYPWVTGAAYCPSQLLVSCLLK